MPSGEGKERVFLVYGKNYTIKGVATSENAAQKKFTDEPIIVVGPVYFDQEIDWDRTQEERFGENFGDIMEYVNLNDGVPMLPGPESWELVRYPHRRRDVTEGLV